MMAIATVDPTTGHTLETFAPHTAAEVETRLGRSIAAFAEYRRVPFAERARWLRRAADLLDAEREPMARLAVLEMGKTIRSARSEVEKCAAGCRYYAEH